MITSKQSSLIGLAALFALASTQACGSDDGGTNSAAGAPAAGAPAAGAPAAGAPAAGAPAAGAPAAGAPAGGAPAGGNGAGGAAAGAPANGGSGGSTGGSGGSSGGGAGKGGGANGGSGGGGSTVTYADVKAIFTASCGTGNCHNAASNHTNFQQGDLYTTLTTAIAATPANNKCNGSTLMTPGDANSFIVKVLGNGGAMCKDGTMDANVGRMPFMCGNNPMCLSADKVKTITDWVTAGAPH